MEIYRELIGPYGSISKNDVIRAERYLVLTGNDYTDYNAIIALENLRIGTIKGISNDKLKYSLPEALKVSLVSTWNARSMQNFLSLRSNKSALWEIRELAYAIYEKLPNEHQYLFEEFVYRKG